MDVILSVNVKNDGQPGPIVNNVFRVLLHNGNPLNSKINDTGN